MTIHYENFSAKKGGCPPEYLSASIRTNSFGYEEIDLEGFMNGEADYVTVASTDEGQLAGLHVFQVHKDKGRRCLYSCATWVDKPFRGLGIGKTLWAVSLSAVRAPGVSVYCINCDSAALIRSVARAFPRLDWKIEVSESALENRRRAA